MSATLHVGNSVYEYKEPNDFSDALSNLDTILNDKLEVMKNYLLHRFKFLEEGRSQGFATVSDYVTYKECEAKMLEITARKNSSRINSKD